MATPTVSREQLEQVRRALCIAEPLDKVSPLVLTTLTVIAHCWHGRVPSSLWTTSNADRVKQQKRKTAPSQPDFKRRAAGDFDY